MLLELSQYVPDIFTMALWVGKINKDIKKENQGDFVQVLTKKIFHHIHELGKGIGDTKRHDQKLLEPPPHVECYF